MIKTEAESFLESYFLDQPIYIYIYIYILDTHIRNLDIQHKRKKAKNCNVSEEPRADSLPLSRPTAIKMARKEMS